MIPFFWNLLISIDSILISLALTILATFYGWQILKLVSGRTTLTLENLVFSIGIGFGLLSFFTLSLGLCNLLYFRLAILLLIFFSLPILPVMVRGLKQRTRQSQKLDSVAKARNDTEKSFALTPEITSRCSQRTTYFWFLLLLFLSLAQLNIALLPPYEYDALEYHFGAPDYYLQQHKITYVPGNVYANFPANTEMFYTLGMLFRDDITGKLFHFYFGLLTALGLFALGKKLWAETTGAIAAVIFLAFPIVFQLNFQANIDLALAGYSVLAFFAWVNWAQEKRKGDIILSGIFVGLGLGCKYTALLTIAFPLFLLLCMHTFSTRKEKNSATLLPTNLLLGTWYFVLCTFVTVSPWLIKNLFYTGNPVFPLLYNLFGGYGWTNELATKFMHAHLSFNLSKPLYQPYSKIILLSLLILLIPLRKEKSIRYLFFYILFGYLFWLLLTEHIERFLMPLLPLVALGLSSLIYQYIRHPVIKYSLSAIVAAVVLFLGIKFTPLLPPTGLTKAEWRRQFLLDTQLPIYRVADEYINSNIPENATILFVGEARRHHLTRPAMMNTVFDQIPILELAKVSRSADDINSGLHEMKVSYLLYNSDELYRLEKFYGPYFDWEKHPREQQLILEFNNKYLLEEWVDSGIKIYRLK